MKKISRVFLFVSAMVCLAVALCLTALAASYDYAHVKTFVDTSAYADITYAKGWVQVATGSSSKRQDAGSDGKYEKEGDLTSGSAIKAAYYNESTKTLVIEGSDQWNYPTANWDDNTKAQLFPNWCKVNASKIEHLEFRNVGGFNNTGYVVSSLTSVKTMKIDSVATIYYGSAANTALLANLSSLTTVGFGSWNKSRGTWIPSEYYNEGVIDLRGFTQLRLGSTVEAATPDLVMYMNAALYGAKSATNLVLPVSVAPVANTTYNLSEISDGSNKFPIAGGTGNLASGKAGYKVTNTAGDVAYTTNWQAPSGWSFVKVNAADIAPYYGQFAGMIPYAVARGATSLTTVTVPAGVNLYRIYKNAFYGCSALREIYIEGTVDDSFIVDAGAFGTGDNLVNGVKIYVGSYSEADIVNDALAAAGYTDPSKVKAVCTEMISPITADGFSVKVDTEYNGLRGIFSFNESAKRANADLGYDFVEYGVIVCSKTTASSHGSNDALLASSNAKVKKIAVQRADGTGENRYIDYSKRQFCIALTGIADKNVMDDVCFIGYSTWQSANGKTVNLFTEYVAADEQPYVNLYEVTLGQMKSGLLNSEVVEKAGGNTDVSIWNVLKKGAVTIAARSFGSSGNAKNTSTSTTYKVSVSATYNSDGSFTYLDNPLYAYTGATSNNYSFNPSGIEATSTTNVLWSLYQDGNEYVAVYRRNPAASKDAIAYLPTLSESTKRVYHPFRENYGALQTNKVSANITIHSPALSTTNAKKVTTIVIDYGVNSAGSTEKSSQYRGAFALANLPYTETIVYPNGFVPCADAQSLFRSDKVLKDVIWANKPASTEDQKKHMGDVNVNVGETLETLADLRGLGKINAEAQFMDSGFENILFAGYGSGGHTQTYSGATAINRVWIDDAGQTSAPKQKTIDLSGDSFVKTLGRQCFDLRSGGYTIKLSNTVVKVSPYSGSYLDAFAVTFGSKLLAVNIEAPNPEFAKSFYYYYLSFIETDYRIYAQNVTVNGKDYKKIREDVCYVDESKLVIYPELSRNVNRDYTYKVSVHQGDQSGTLPVYNHTMFDKPCDRSVGGDQYRRYSMFAFCGDTVRVDIKVSCDFTSYTVFPSAKNFRSTFDAATGTISVYLDEPDYFGIRLDDMDNSIISIFADRPEYPDEYGINEKSGNAIYIAPGEWYLPTSGDGRTETTDGHRGTLYVTKTNTTIYIAPGAVLYGRIYLPGAATGSSVIGHGAMVDPFADSRVLDIRDGGSESGSSSSSPYKSQFVQVYASKFYFDGPVLMDARCFNIMIYTNKAEVRNYKALSTMMTTDGITDGVKEGGIYEHCWLYVGDNALVLGVANSYFNDITVGTTCSVIFPQGHNTGIVFENIHVFRANDGIITHRYNPGGGDLKATITFRNLDCMDVVNYPRFVFAQNMGLSTEKVFTFENISLPYASGVTDPHANAIAAGKTRNALVRLSLGSGIPTGNYTMNFTNVYMDGVLLDSQDKAVLSLDTLPEGATMTFKFATANNGYKAVVKNEHTVNYVAPGKVYVGSLRVDFEDEVIIEGSTFYLPAQEILEALRTTATPATVTKNGKSYIAHTSLKSSGAASAVSVSGGNLKITPVAPSSTTNLIVQNSGLITREFEVNCYQIDMVQDTENGIYYAYPYNKQYNGGIGVLITDEIKMYGAGTYTFTLKAMCQANEGGSYTPLRVAFIYDTKEKYTTVQKTYTLTSSWTEYTVTLDVTDAMIENGIDFSALVSGTNNVAVSYYAVKDIKVTKTK